MNNTTQLLKQASELEKKAYTDFVTTFTSSGITGLVQGGVSFDKASAMVKEACEQNPMLLGLQANIQAFEKSAEYIEQLETKVQELEKTASEVQATPAAKPKKDNGPMSKLASAGFSQEEIDMISQLPENLMTKVANVGSQPWEMGAANGVPREKTDPMLEFLLNT